MRRLAFFLFVSGLLLVPTSRSWADDSLQAVIDRAIKAHGGAEKLDKAKAVQSKAKGTLDTPQGVLPFTQEVYVQMPDKVKSVMELQVAGQKVNLTSVYDGKKVYVNVNGMDLNLGDKILEEVKEQLHAGEISRLTVLKDKKFELSPLGEVKVDGKDAIGIKVSSKGHKDVNLFFDKQTGFHVKTERRSVDPMSGQEFTEETVMSEMQDVDGMKVPKKTVSYRDGKKFMDAEVTEYKLVDKFDDSMFAKP